MIVLTNTPEMEYTFTFTVVDSDNSKVIVVLSDVGFGNVFNFVLNAEEAEFDPFDPLSPIPRYDAELQIPRPNVPM